MPAAALGAGFMMGWANMVHMSKSENHAYLAYFGVLAVGGVGAWLARLEARGLARALFAMAGTLVVVGVMVGSPDVPPVVVRNRLDGHVAFVALFIASGLLFRHASLAGSK
jgi:hypothetical protein